MCAKWLGTLPYSIEDEDGVYLLDDDGVTTGPYDSEENAQKDLWEWFDKRGRTSNAASKEGKLQKGNLRLVSFEGVSLEAQEGNEGGAKEEDVEETGCKSSSRSQDGEGRNR